MSKNNLLNESTIRKFMKLASIEPLASDFLGRIQEVEDKEELEEGAHEDEKVEEDIDLEEGGDMMYKDDDMGDENQPLNWTWMWNWTQTKKRKRKRKRILQRLSTKKCSKECLKKNKTTVAN